MALVPYALTTTATVKTLLSITGATQDGLIELLINGVTDYIERFCRRRFLRPATDVVELVRGTGLNYLLLANYGADSSLATLEERSDLNNWEVVAPADYALDDIATGRIELAFNTNKGANMYRATYRGGFDAIPNDLDLACAQLVVHEYNQRQGGGEIESERIGDYTVSFATGAQGASSKDVDRIIDGTIARYKRPVV